MSEPFWVDSDRLADGGREFDEQAKQVHRVYNSVADLSIFDGSWGDDDAGNQFEKTYQDTKKTFVDGVLQVAAQFDGTSRGLVDLSRFAGDAEQNHVQLTEQLRDQQATDGSGIQDKSTSDGQSLNPTKVNISVRSEQPVPNTARLKPSTIYSKSEKLDPDVVPLKPTQSTVFVRSEKPQTELKHMMAVRGKLLDPIIESEDASFPPKAKKPSPSLPIVDRGVPPISSAPGDVPFRKYELSDAEDTTGEVTDLT
ncbi:hypothetical protein [Amycolatopsis sp. H20-H5]|uniref:hypothetical protein n=1 Tax=Amycolatopsis sp. H20-H5 TaxID=3046309 RepID=UPI002DB6E6BE|nr:hypothetical protein [Amycolatopsis sp. H20-H5]MEC3975213.1 hypothetical protein [Amycolatopsis sp. H20-H5]